MKKIALACILFFAIASTAQSDDLYEVYLENDDDAALLESSNTNPVWIISNGYLVLAPENLSDQFRNMGLNTVLVQRDISLDDIFIQRKPSDLDVSQYTLLYEDNNCRLLFDDSGNLINEKGLIFPLKQRNIVIRYNEPFTKSTLKTTYPLELDSLMSLILQDSHESYMYRLEAFNGRLAGTDSNYAALDWIENKFIEFGYDSVYIDPFMGEQLWDYSPVQCNNVVATKIGKVNPGKIIVIGGHFDVVPDCPGADDNGSGTAGTLEIARIIKNIATDMTIVFIAFDSEESWLWGSYHYVDAAVARGDDIVLMINLDMIGHIYNSDRSNVYYGPDSSFASIWKDIGINYVNITADLSESIASDHQPFIEAGYDAIFVQEKNFSTNYHQPTDSTTYINFEYMTRMVKASFATAYVVSQPDAEYPSFIFDLPDGKLDFVDPLFEKDFEIEITSRFGGEAVPGSCYLHYNINEGEFDSIAMTEISPDIYQASFPSGDCYDIFKYYVSIEEVTSGRFYYPSLTYPYEAMVSDSTLKHMYDDFNYDQGWEIDNSVGVTQGFWERDIPIYTYITPPVPSPQYDADGSGFCYITDNHFWVPLFNGEVYLTSPPFKIIGDGFISFNYYLYLTTQYGTDYLKVEINNNNGEGPWYNLRQYNANSAWQQGIITFSELESYGIEFTSEMRIRFTAHSQNLTNSLEAGLDNFLVRSVHCDTVYVDVDAPSFTGRAPFNVDFSGSCDFDVSSWNWDFGDGQYADIQNPSHIYENPGIYDVRVDVVSEYGEVFSQYNSLVGVEADSIFFIDISGPAGYEVKADIYVNNYLPLNEIVIPFNYSGPLNLRFLRFSNENLRTEYIPPEMRYFDSYTKRAVITLTAPDNSPIIPGTGPALSVFFRIHESGLESDTTSIIFEEVQSYFPEFNSVYGSYEPILLPGKVSIGGCCTGIRGNVDNDENDLIDIADLVYYVEFSFNDPPGPEPSCLEEADVDASGEMDIGDIVYLVEYQFNIPPGPEPLDCY